jgi:hypothetical protein
VADAAAPDPLRVVRIDRTARPRRTSTFSCGQLPMADQHGAAPTQMRRAGSNTVALMARAGTPPKHIKE